ncbi:Fic family protein [Candidatus Woesearchaeota archaeon]|nr:Fic family protein [Candidatus Woesearchaeota archaeon]
MVHVQERKLKGKSYLYLDKSIRIGGKVFKISKYLGVKADLSKARINDEMKKFSLELDEKIVSYLTKHIENNFKIQYPLIQEEVRKIEEMNLKYKEIKRSLTRSDWLDIKKRFIANFIFESNALEGNSLTLKNFSEIIFENKTAASTDLREVYDAKNSYAVFSKLFNERKEMSEASILGIHRMIMKNIDERTGYKKIPNVILGRNMELTIPENVPEEMKKLIRWYEENNKLHPLELAFKFHHKFERIHPFADGNGRVGRMLLNHILIRKGYYPIIIRKSHRNRYLKALRAADLGKSIPLMRFALEQAKETYRKFFEVYYNYL